MGKLMTKDEFVNKLIQRQRTDVVLLGDYVNTATKTLFGCTKETCGHIWLSTPNHIMNGNGCPICAHRKLDKDINSVAVLRPDLVKYFANPDDAYKVMPSSHKKVDLICPDCHTTRSMIMYNLTFEGFSCQECSAYISYPNKFIRAIMNQFQGEYDYLEYEWSDKWTERKRYDVYFEKDGQKYTIEMQGGQHFIYGWKHQRTLDEIIKIDKTKEENAIKHNIIPISIDARKSDFDFIMRNVKNSILNKLFDLSTIDVKKCQEDITSNVIRLVCDKYQSNSYVFLKDIANEFQISRVTLVKYLKIGTKIGWCNYAPDSSSKTRVRALNADKKVIGEYNSISECIHNLSNTYDINLCSANISRACKRGYSCCGLYFEYI